MKTIRNFVTLFGLSLMLAAFGAAGARAQGLTMTNVGGTFNLPLEAQWGSMTLPAGNYALHFGYAASGMPVVEVRGTEKGSPQGIFIAQAHNNASGTKNAIICVREGDGLLVQGLELAAAGESASFSLPRGARLTARQRNSNGTVQVAEAPMLIQRVPISLNAK
jgi:hypothetical protein